MADLVGIRVKCPECGATTRANGDIVTCTYCGTESRVQRRTQVLQRPIQLPPVGPTQPRLVAVEHRSKTGLWIGLVLIIIGVTFVPMIIGATLERSGTGVAATTSSSETWE